jgi:hypothetical protein
LVGLDARVDDLRQIVPSSHLGWLATDCLFDYVCNGSHDRHLCNCGHNRLSDVALASPFPVGVGGQLKGWNDLSVPLRHHASAGFTGRAPLGLQRCALDGNFVDRSTVRTIVGAPGACSPCFHHGYKREQRPECSAPWLKAAVSSPKKPDPPAHRGGPPSLRYRLLDFLRDDR